MRTLLVAVYVALAGLAVAPALAKEGVEATLDTLTPLDAAPGEQLSVAWTLTSTDRGKRRPFNAIGVFVRLLSASDGKATTAFASADAHPAGEYAATVIVPEGGIGRIEIGLRGWSDHGPSDLLFPIANDPFRARADSASAPSRPASTGSAPAASSQADKGHRRLAAWPAAAAVVLILALGCLAAVLRNRRHAASRARPDPAA